VYLRTQSTARTPNRLITAAPFLRQQHAGVRGRSSETLEHVPVAEVIGQIAPRRAIHKTASTNKRLFLAVPTLVTFFTRTIPLNPRPLRVRSSRRIKLASTFASPWESPNVNTT
jgi:hypothetical protein